MTTRSAPLRVPLLLLALLMAAAGCAALKASDPLFPQRDYERLLAGPLDADYIGNENCLKACHQHDSNASLLARSVHGHQVAADTGMPLVNCETCHGPGSLAVLRAAEDKRCDTSKLIPLANLPAGARSLLCLRCHSSYSMESMQNWVGSSHERNEVSCSDCHRLHEDANQKLDGSRINAICSSCHPAVWARFSFFSRHPLAEGKMTCVSCHQPHGSIGGDNLAGDDTRAVCIGCHADKTGPFVFEHADVTEDCGTCHDPHGSAFAGLLRFQEPFLCLQCHSGHSEHGNASNPDPGFKRGMFTRCTSCHSEVHGSDFPGDSSPRSIFLR